MAVFVIGSPVESAEPAIEVTVDPAAPLSVGRHTFQLVVVDDAGNESQPDSVDVCRESPGGYTFAIAGSGNRGEREPWDRGASSGQRR